MESLKLGAEVVKTDEMIVGDGIFVTGRVRGSAVKIIVGVGRFVDLWVSR